jgi:hypothetical protein
LADFENWASWQAELGETEQTSRSSMDAGATFRQALEIKGKRVDLLCEVTGYEPNRDYPFDTTHEVC